VRVRAAKHCRPGRYFRHGPGARRPSFLWLSPLSGRSQLCAFARIPYFCGGSRMMRPQGVSQ
jgi:hypothetical protein